MMGLMTRELVTLLLRLRESLRLFSQEKGHPSGSGVTLETSPWVVRSYKVQISIGKTVWIPQTSTLRNRDASS